MQAESGYLAAAKGNAIFQMLIRIGVQIQIQIHHTWMELLSGVTLDNIDIDKEILQNINMAKIGFGISNATKVSQMKQMKQMTLSF